MQLKVQMLIHQTKTSFWRTFHHSQPISSLLISNPSNILCIVQYNLYFVNARALKNPSRNVSAKTLTTNFAIHVKIGRTLMFTVNVPTQRDQEQELGSRISEINRGRKSYKFFFLRLFGSFLSHCGIDKNNSLFAVFVNTGLSFLYFFV